MKPTPFDRRGRVDRRRRPDRHPPCPGPGIQAKAAAGHRREGRAAVRRQGRRAPGQRRRPGPGAEDPGGRDGPLHPRRGRGHRPGRRDALARLHRRAHPPDGRVDRRLEAGLRRQLPPRGGREGDRIHRARAEGAGGRVHHGARRGERATCSTSACATRSPAGWSPARGCWSAVHALGARGGHADETGLRHDLHQGARAGRGDRPRAGRVPRGGPLPGQVRRRRDQVLRLGRRAVAGRRGRHAATDPRGDDGPDRRGPPAAQEGGRALPRRPRGPGGDPRRGRLDRARLVPDRGDPGPDEETGDLPRADAAGRRVDRRQARQVPAGDRRQGPGRAGGAVGDVPHRRAAGREDRLRHRLGRLAPRDQRRGVRPDDRAGHVADRRASSRRPPSTPNCSASPRRPGPSSRGSSPTSSPCPATRPPTSPPPSASRSS